MKKVLIVSTILPVDELKSKARENDFLIRIEEEFKKTDLQVEFSYIYILPYTNFIFALLSKKWKEIHALKPLSKLHIGDKEILIIRLFILPWKTWFRASLFKLGFSVNKKKIAEFLNNKNPTIVHALNIENDLFLAKNIAKEYQIPFVVTLHGINQKIDFLNRKFIQKAKSINAISLLHKTLGLEKLKKIEKKIEFIPIGIDDVFFESNASFKTTKIHFVSVCRLVSLKNLDLVISALSKIDLDYEYSIYGDGPEFSNLNKLVERLNLNSKIKFYGHINNNEIPKLLSENHIFIMPSFPESLGKAYLEAMAVGLTIIASKHSGMKGIVRDGIEGFLVEHANETEIFEKIQFFIDNQSKIREMGSKAKLKAQEFRWEKIITALNEIYS